MAATRCSLRSSAAAQPDDLSCFFNCNVVFGAEFDAITPTIDMDRSMAAADASMARYAQSYIETIAARSATLDGKVTELVAALLPTPVFARSI
jgi:hypothetical protein